MREETEDLFAAGNQDAQKQDNILLKVHFIQKLEIEIQLNRNRNKFCCSVAICIFV